MLLAKRVRPEWQDKIPAIVHVDGTARVQTVRQEHNERLYRLLKEFEAITGVPVLLNTSFNVKGEHALARRDGELGGQVALLGELRLLEIGAVGEVAAGILPVAIEEEIVDGAVDVVVMRHVALCAARRIELQQAARRR